MALTTKAIEEDTQRAAAEVQLQNYGRFIEDYTNKLNKLEERLQQQSIESSRCYTPGPSTLTVAINFEPVEQADATDVINCDNKIIDKIVRVFSALCCEVSFIRDEFKCKYLNLILYYGDDIDENATSYEDCQLSISKILADLQRLSAFIKHCERLLLEIVSQLSCFYRLDLEIADVGMYEVFDVLGETLIVLITVQEVVANNTTLIYHWSLYKRTIQLASHSASEFPYNLAKISQLDQLITKLESRVIACKIFDNALGLPYDRKTNVKNNKRLAEHLNGYLRKVVLELERTVQHESVESAAKWAKACVTFVLSINLFGNYDKKFLKSLHVGVRKFALITLCANVTFRIDEFLLKYAGHLLKPAEKKLFLKTTTSTTTNSNNSNNDNVNSQQCIQDITIKLNNDAPFYAVQVLSWILRLEQVVKRDITNLNIEYLREISGLLFEGIRYASCIKTTLCTICNLYVIMKKPMYKTSVISFCKLVEILMCIEYIYYRHHSRLANVINYIVQYTRYECIGMMDGLKKELLDGKYVKDSSKIDTVSSLVIAQDALNSGPTTELRVLIAKLCLNLVNQGRYFTDVERQRLTGTLEKLSATCKLQRNLKSLLECSFMYWNRGILPIYFEEINSKRYNVNRVEYLLHSILLHPPENCYQKYDDDDVDNSRDDIDDMMILAANNGAAAAANDESSPSSTAINDMYENVYVDCLSKLCDQIIRPLCGRIEENLRLNVLEQHLRRIDQPNTLQAQRQFELNNFYGIRATTAIYLDGKYLDVKKRIEDYLNKTYYDLTTVALHNYQIHGEMKLLAGRKFGLQTMDDNLPNRGLEYGVDLLEITRNIDVFVASYFYNLNNQLFIEMRSNNKYLNSINITHIANSIRSHGMGIMNTAVNYTYQFLRQKLGNFSQFLFDEQIKSRLLKDISAFNEQTASNNNNNNNNGNSFSYGDVTSSYYSFERAERFNRGIQKLGVAKDGSTCLDQFRSLITQIGNALGYVRMIKSGGLHCCSNSAVFIPNLKYILNFQQLCRSDRLSELCCRSAADLDEAIGNLADKITDGTNYFKLLVDVFAPVLRDPKNNHLRNFYVIIPSLMINFVDYFVGAKESMIKKNSNTTTACCFTDDGFAIGCAYLLEVLNLQAEFDSLHWFQSVTERNRNTVRKLQENIAIASSKDDQKLQHTLNLSLKRIKQYQKEFSLLRYNFYSARVLFENRNETNNYEELVE